MFNNDLSKKNWNKAYLLNETSNLWGDTIPIIHEIIHTISEVDHFLILDLPCGDGRNLLPLANTFPFVIGADSSIYSLHIARERLIAQQLDKTLLINTDIYSTPFIDNQIDVILCWDLLGHLKDVSSAIAELLRILKPGGLIITSFFSLNDSTRGMNMQSIGSEEYLYNSQFYFKFYTKSLIEDIIGKFDMEIISLKEVSWVEGPHEGYRDYPHEHTSWSLTIRKK